MRRSLIRRQGKTRYEMVTDPETEGRPGMRWSLIRKQGKTRYEMVTDPDTRETRY